MTRRVLLKSKDSKSIRGWIMERFAEGRGRYGLRMAPMIDIIFLLLIFFLVAAKWRPREDFLPLQIPAAKAADTARIAPDPLIIHILDNQTGCRVQIADKSVELDEDTFEQDLAVLAQQLKSTFETQRRYASDPVEIACGPAVKWGHLARIYNLLYGMGINDITFAMTERPKNVSGR